jgi:hypothetical protein
MVGHETFTFRFCNQLEIEVTEISNSAIAASSFSVSSFIKSFVALENKHGLRLVS